MFAAAIARNQDLGHCPGPAAHVYVCPACRGPLITAARSFRCEACGKAYPVRAGIPDFIACSLRQSPHRVLRMERFINWIAPIYETAVWYPLVLRLVSGQNLSLAQLRATVERMVGGVSGPVLDVACGPGTYGRALATPRRNVYGIDIAYGMLRTGFCYTIREHISGMQFARAQVEALPFRGEFFNAALCCGALHLFADATRALREINRTLKPGAGLIVITVIADNTGILRFPVVRRWFQSRGLHIFDWAELLDSLKKSQFVLEEAYTYGSLLLFHARKGDIRNGRRTCPIPVLTLSSGTDT